MEKTDAANRDVGGSTDDASTSIDAFVGRDPPRR